MTAKVDIAVSAIPSYGNSISSPGEERGAQSDAPIAERVHLGDLGANAENFDLEHAAIANAASSGENAGRNGWLPSPAIKGDKRLEKDARLITIVPKFRQDQHLPIRLESGIDLA
jgi:hypothetical protein